MRTCVGLVVEWKMFKDKGFGFESPVTLPLKLLIFIHLKKLLLNHCSLRRCPYDDCLWHKKKKLCPGGEEHVLLINMQTLGIENCKLLGRDMIISHYLGFKRISRSYVWECQIGRNNWNYKRECFKLNYDDFSTYQGDYHSPGWRF